MSDMYNWKSERKYGNALFGLIGLSFAILGLFFLPYWFGSLAILFGAVDQMTPVRQAGVVAIIVGIIDMLFPLFFLAVLF